MERETPLSPSWNPLSPDPLRAPRRASQYRLFPTVEATPPASPVAFQFQHAQQSQRKPAATSRRRSSSLSSDTSISRRRRTPPSQLALSSSSPSKETQKAGQASLTDDSTRSDLRRNGRKGSHENVRGRSDSALEDSSISMSDSHANLRKDADRPPPAVKAVKPVIGFNPSVSSLSPVAEHFQLQGKARVRTKPRPNLRIAIHKQTDEEHGSKPLPRPKLSPQVGDEPRTKLHSAPEAKIAQSDGQPKQPPVSVIAHGRASGPSASGICQNPPDATSSDMLPSQILDKPLPPIRPDFQRSDSNDGAAMTRPSTSDGAKSIASYASHGTILQAQLAQRFAASTTNLRPAQQTKAPRSPLRSLFSRNKAPQDPEPRPKSPKLQPPNDSYAVPSVATPPKDQGRAVTSDTSLRPDTNDQVTEHSPVEPLSKPSAALIAARAHVAALRNSNASASTRSLSRSSGSDLGARFRGLSDPLLRRPITPAPADLVETLKELSEECDALHERYSNLRAERQKLSTAIITNLRDLKAGPEYVDTILNDQLALAAVSSSMDICFAKLKSLECRKEDAISALVQQATPSQQSPSDKLAAMIASSMAITRKPSTDSGMRFALNGRSTPEPSDSASAHRLTQPSVRTLSYGSDLDVSDLRLSSQSRKQSLGLDHIRYSDGDKQPPETIPEVVESPRLNRLSRNLQGLDLQYQLPSSATLISGSTSSTLKREEHATDGEKGDVDTFGRESYETSGSRDDSKLFEKCPKQQHTHGKKAAKILGLVSTKKPLPTPTPEMDTSTHPQQPSSSDVLQDLEAQLSSFPKPNATLAPTAGRRDTGGSFLTNGSSADSISEPELPPPPPRRRMTRQHTEMKKRDPSAHTIKVYMEHDDEDIFEYYERLRQGQIS